MDTSTISERDLVIDLLSGAFDQNRSVNYIIKQDSTRTRRIRALMAYSYDLCRLSGKVFVSEDKQACALVLFPDRKKTTSFEGIMPFEYSSENPQGMS